MNKFIMILLVLANLANSQYITQTCSCSLLQTEADCFMSSKQQCNWNSFEQKCELGAISSEFSQGLGTYCEQFSQLNCHKLQPCEFCVKNGPCQWYDEKCSHFTGCTAFNKSKNSQCQSISERCITNGFHCVEIGPCDSYMTEIACEQDMNKRWCFWDKSTAKCKYPETCEELPLTFTQDYQCKSQISTCVSNSTGGCKTQTSTQSEPTSNTLSSESLSTSVLQYETCLEITKSQDCKTYPNGVQCFWQDDKCLDKICSNLPKDLKTNLDCQLYLNYCITTNGGGCINNGACSVANIPEACSKDINKIDCFWNGNKCVEKTCGDAPSTITTNSDCDLFLMNQCVVKQGGGCKVKECKDLSGSTHKICNKLKSNCTVGLNSQCAEIMNCQNTLIKDACIEGLDGPCLWIVNRFSKSQPQGKCYKYNSCQSIEWNTDQQCKQISPLCTTDGTKCIPITSCSETNTNGGCVTGFDGQCMQTVFANNKTQEKCQKFNSCTDAYYLKHEQCYKANPLCTSNGITGCVPISSCSAYTTQEACKFNNQGVLCIWNVVCRDSICSDFKYPTHQECYSISKNLTTKCTTDGSQCIDYGTCSSYQTQSICQKAQAKDGQCIWSNFGSCKVRECSDIPDPSPTNCPQQQGNCTFDGLSCIKWSLCSEYKTKIACNTIGLDGICYWSSGSCSLMTSCQSAYKDEQACLKVKFKCYMNSYGVCDTHSCSSYQLTNGVCSNFLTFDDSSQYVCKAISGQCTNVDPNNLNQQECYKISGYTYRWSMNTSRCEACYFKQITNNSYTPNKSNSSKNASSGNISTPINPGSEQNTTNCTGEDNATQTDTSLSFLIRQFILLFVIILN